MNILSPEHIWSIAQKTLLERNLFQNELLIQFFRQYKFFEVLCRQESPLAKKLELSRIIEKHIPYMRAVSFRQGDTIYFKEPRLRDIFIVVKGIVGIYKESIQEKPVLKKAITRSNTKLNAIVNMPILSAVGASTQLLDKSKSKDISDPQIPNEENVSPQLNIPSYKGFSHSISKLPSKEEKKPVFGDPGLAFIDKLGLIKKVKSGECFGVVEGENFVEQISFAESEVWIMVLDVQDHKAIMDDFKEEFVRICNLLQSILIKTFQFDEVQLITPYFREQNAHFTELLYLEGDPAKVSYILVHGSVHLTKKVDNQIIYKSKMMYKKLKAGTIKELVVDKIVPGNSFGEEMIYENKYRKLSAVSQSDYTIMLKINEEAWNELKLYQPNCAKKFVESIKANEFWREQRLAVHLKEITAIKMRLREIGSDIKGESLPCVDVLLLDPRSHAKTLTPNQKEEKQKPARAPLYVNMLDRFVPGSKYLESWGGKPRLKPHVPKLNLNVQNEEEDKLPDDVMKKLVNFISLPDRSKRYFSFKPTSSDYLTMNPEEKEKLFKISKEYEKFSPGLSSRKNSNTSARSRFPPIVNTHRNWREKKDDYKRGIKLNKNLSSRNDIKLTIEEYGLMSERLPATPEEDEEDETLKIPEVNKYKEEHTNTHVTRLKHLSNKLEEVWMNIGDTINQLSSNMKTDPS